MADDSIKYSDLIQPDDSIKNLTSQLEQLNSVFGDLLNNVKANAKNIAGSLRNVNTATAENKVLIDDAALAAARLAKAQQELRIAMTDTGKEIAWLKSQTVSQNKLSADMQRQSSALAGSYNKLKAEMQEYIRLWKAMSSTERSSAFGHDVLKDIMNLKAQLSNLDSMLRTHVRSLTEVQKAEQRLNFLRSQEGQHLLELKQQIKDVIASQTVNGQVLSEVAQAQQKYQYACSATNQQLKELDLLTREANKKAALQVQLNTSAAGSYNKLAAQYELNKIRLNEMSLEERSATAVGKALEQETLQIYKRMTQMQEAIGNHKLSMGNYKLAWNGLSNAVTQVIRELPAATMGLNMFFLAISNNVPILVDEINRVREKNKLLLAEGKEAIPIGKQIVKAIFNWQTALILLLTAMSMHGKEIIAWVKNLFGVRSSIIETTEAFDNMVGALEKANDSYGKHVATLKKLGDEWRELTSNRERLQFIKDNKSAFDQLDISVRNVNEAERVFAEEGTDAVIAAFRARAKAAAAQKLVVEEYEKALVKQAEAEAERLKGNTTFDKVMSFNLVQGANGATTLEIQKKQADVEKRRLEDRINFLKDEAKVHEKNAERYYDLENRALKESRDILKKAGIEEAHKNGRNGGAGRQPKDLTDIIMRNDLELQKKYELSLSELQKQEFEKRRIEAIDQANQTIRALQEKFRKNQVYLTNPEGKYRPLTAEQRAMVEKQQKEINAIIENTRRKLNLDLADIDYEAQVDKNKKLRQMLDYRLDLITDDIKKEKGLRLKQLAEQRKLYSTKGMTIDGKETTVTGDLTPEELAAFEREREIIIAQYNSVIYKLKEQSINSQLELVKRGSDEELALLKKRYNNELKLALAANMLKPIEERQDPEDIKALTKKRSRLKIGSVQMRNFDEAQAQAEAEFNIVKRNEYYTTLFKLNAEKERWQKQIALAKQGAIEWSDAQLAEAEALVKKLERQIEEKKSFIGLIGKHGVAGAILTRLGFDDDALSAWSTATNTIIDNIKSIMDAEIESAEASIEAYQKRVDAAQAAYDAEIEARNNGYANSVATAKAELQNEKRMLAQKQKLAESAQRKQESLNTVMQASSLVTASANLWSSFSSIPIVGPALAIAAIAGMWTSFAVAKIRAAQVARSSQQQYGEGGLEFLEGGSHASGNDIDLNTKNSKGYNMRAEGGEALAIINRRNTRKYRRVLPSLIESLNTGCFEEKYARAFKAGEELTQHITYEQKLMDLSRLEEDVRAIKRNNELQIYALADGTIIEKRNNVIRKLK